MITSLHLHNFKAFENLDLELRPITLILGPNNSGKSSILSALRVLVQTLESRDPDVPLLLNGIMGDLGTFKDIVYSNNRRKPIEIAIGVIDNQKIKKSEQLDLLNNYSKWDLSSENDIKINLTFKYRAKRRELILGGCEVKIDNQILLKTKYSEDTEKNIIEMMVGTTIPSGQKSSLSKYLRMRNFIPQLFFLFESEETFTELFGKNPSKLIRNMNNTFRLISKCIENIEYLGAMRIPPSRLYTYSGERRNRIGAAGENAANILAMDKNRGGRKANQISVLVRDWLAQAGIASNLLIEPTSDSFYEIKIQHPQTNEVENLADVGLGNGQILPVLVGGYNLPPGFTYMVEEPEIHLHPKAQAELGSFFLDLYNKGIQSIIETHSEYLVIRLQQYVADRKISPKDIQILYVDNDKEKKFVKVLELDDEGFFIQDWPGGFFPEKLEEAKNLAKIRSKYY
jgi:predicted ATPase